MARSSEALISLAQATMVSYATVPATDLESEATLLNSKPKTKISLLVGGVAAMRCRVQGVGRCVEISVDGVAPDI